MCTGLSFTNKNNELFFGRNLDVPTNYGEQVVVTPKGYHLNYHFIDNQITNQAIIGMGIVVEDYPFYFDCASQNGLCIAGLNFPGNAYFTEEPVANKTNLTPYEFMIWAVTAYSSVKDLKEALKNVNLVNKPFNPNMPIAPLHWIISDANDCIVVEQTKAKGLVIYDNFVGILTNNPEFDWHLTNLNNYLNLSPNDALPHYWHKQKLTSLGVGTGNLGLPGGAMPSSRFVKAAFLNAHYPIMETETENIAKAFNILKAVAMVNGSVVNNHKQNEFTAYTSCYSTHSQTYYYNLLNDFAIKSVSLKNIDINNKTLLVI